MIEVTPKPPSPRLDEAESMHALYRRGGLERAKAPHIVYSESDCPHEGCGQLMQAIDSRLEDHGRAVHDPLVRAWWDDTGFVGRCPHCRVWVHFTIRAKEAVTPEEADRCPKLPDDWHTNATIL